MNLSTLILKGRVVPIIEDLTVGGVTRPHVTGYRRTGKSRKHGTWTLNVPKLVQTMEERSATLAAEKVAAETQPQPAAESAK